MGVDEYLLQTLAGLPPSTLLIGGLLYCLNLNTPQDFLRLRLQAYWRFVLLSSLGIVLGDLLLYGHVNYIHLAGHLLLWGIVLSTLRTIYSRS